ncbi:MAG: glucosaminidase domain-containing protein [Chitinophagaceae bacterium]
MKLKNTFLLIGLFVSLGVQSQTAAPATISIEEYINTYKEIAMKEMIRTGVPASITLAQGIVETENGNSKLVKKSNNHFGIKCKETWTGPSVSHDDDAPGECFRKYGSAEESYIDHSNFLVTRKHYAPLFTLDPADYKAWAYGLKKAGYATNPRYPEMLIKYIETYNLNEYSLVALGKKKEESSVVKNKTTALITETKPVVEEKKPAPAIVQKPVAEAKPQPAIVKVEEKKPVVETKPQPVVAPVVQKPVVNYPSGEFKINETRVVYLTKGTPFLSIAQQFNVQLKWLFDFNDLTEMEAVPADQLIYLQRKRRTGANEFHVVAEGETLYDIAQAQGIRMEALLQLNLLNASQLPAAGERLNLQTPATVAPKLVPAKNVISKTEASQSNEAITEKIIHIVQPKETLYSISKKYEVSVTDLQQWNQLGGVDLKEGMELIINK